MKTQLPSMQSFSRANLQGWAALLANDNPWFRRVARIERKDLSQVRKLGAAVIVAVLAAIVPALAVYRIGKLRHITGVSIVAIIAYEVVLAIISFAVAVSANLRSRWVTRASDFIDSWMLLKLSPFTRAYLRYVQALTKYMETRGVSTAGPHILEMADVQVNLSLSATPLNTLTSDPVRRHAKVGANSSATIWYWLKEAHENNAVLSIIGPPGSGKTTLLRHVAFTLAKDSRGTGFHREVPAKIPVLVNLREYDFSHAAESLSLSSLLRHSLSALDRQEPPSWVETNLRHGKFAILLDGLDEIADDAARSRLTEWLIHQSSAQNGNLFVLTSRPFGYKDNPVPNALLVEVQPLAENQITAFVQQWYRAISIRSHAGDNDSSRLAAKVGAADLLGRLDQTPALFELTANPLLLTMIVNVHYYRAGALPESRAELYDEICDVFLAKRDRVRNVRVDIPGPQKRAGLQVLAYEMMHRRITEAAAADAVSWISGPLIRMTSIDPMDFLKRIEQASGLLIENERGIYSFAHLTFQEYLAAEFIRDSGKADELAANVSSPWWRETIRLYAAISDATSIVNACLNHRDEPELIVLGVHCAEEANSPDQGTRQAIEECINPPGARDNEAVRHTAARARLQLRITREIPLKKSSFISGAQITWLEYQYFIDSLTDTVCVVPDHWHTNIYPEGAEKRPVTGIRYSDAEKFCTWLDSELQSSFRFRLPRSEEIEKAFELRPDGELRSLSYWTTTQLPSSRDGRFWPLLRNSSTGARRDAYPSPDRGIYRTYLGKVLAEDLRNIRESLSEESAIDSEALSLLVDRCWDKFPTCDAGQIGAEAALAETLVRDYGKMQSTATDAIALLHARLNDLAKRLLERASEVLDRQAYSHRLSHQMTDLRSRTRRMALEASAVCVTLHRAHGGEALLPPLEKVTRPTRKTPNPSREATVIANVLAHAYMGIYIDLLVLTTRIEGYVIPCESMVFVREFSDVIQIDSAKLASPVETDIYLSKWMRLAKRSIDIVTSAFALFVLSPLLLAIAVAIRLQDGGPALFTQTRVGKDGHLFKIYKFRTMVVDAEKRVAELRALNNLDGVLFKMRGDPRVTAIGARLRRYSFDELPQLINVLRGDMSLVGPRPALLSEAAAYTEEARLSLAVSPGLTGMWQVHGRSDLSWEESVRLELRYVENWSLALDMQILWKTLSVIWKGSGAY
jgi:lipopolysaccharide/colanic/teichoic acid biosynthesis glycosyltransferase/energy-coupling factor transporter ATP-binding protein EcfA2